MSQVKEPMHFSREENWKNGNEDYLKLFARATDEVYIGEGSTEYTKLPFREGVPKRLYDFNSQSRLIYIMRDPYERIVSQYKHNVKAGREKEPLREAIQKPSDYLTNSYYSYQLRPYLELFGPEALFIDTFENLVASPADFCKRIFRWLKIDDTFIPPNLSHAFHTSPSRYQLIDDGSVVGKTAILIRQLPIISKLVPPFCHKWIASVSPMKFDIDFSSLDFKKEIEETRDAVMPFLCSWIGELEQLTDISFEMWPTRRTCNSGPVRSSNLTAEIKKCIDIVLKPK
jgi:hypothetical protein